MTFQDIETYFGNSNRFEIETGMSHTNWINWRKYGYVPILSQLKIQFKTNGALKADLAHTPTGKHTGSYKDKHK